MRIEKYGAIDIGSNAIRLLIASVIIQEGVNPIFRKTSLVRLPIRLGADVFINEKISEANYLRMLDSIKAFKLLMNVHNVVSFRACATSAMRDASNGKVIAEKIKNETGITIDIIDGKEEAKIIASTDLGSFIQKDKVYLYVDVGGGSTEFTFFENGKPVASQSFKLGTIRLLNNIVDDRIWKEVKYWIKEQTKNYTSISLMGSGGNINSLFKSSGISIGSPITYLFLSSKYKFLKSLSYKERIVDLGMNHDRADVILPAIKIFLSAMKWSRAQNIHVPKIGLSDGIIKSLFYENNN